MVFDTVKETYYKFRFKNVIYANLLLFIFLKYSFNLISFIKFFLVINFFNIFTYVFNDLKDAKYDFYDKKKRSRNPFLDEKYKLFGRYLLLFSVFFMFLLSYFESLTLFLFTLILFLFAFNYSAGLRAKNKPVLDLLVHGLWPVFIYLTGFFYLKIPINFPEIIFFSYCFLLSVIAELLQELRDYEVDKKTNERTSVVVFGQSFARYLTKFIFLFLGLIFLIFLNNIYFIVLIGALVFFTLKTDYKNHKNALILKNSFNFISAYLFFTNKFINFLF